jgi:two-component system, OmpR family, response regulator
MAPRVLLVDDEEIFRETLAKLLKRRGLEVTTAPGGREALDLLAARPVDVVVLDLRMPGMDGIETLRRIAATRPEARVIILTGHGSVEAGVQALGASAYDFLLKPVAPEQLMDVVIAAAGGKDGPG